MGVDVHPFIFLKIETFEPIESYISNGTGLPKTK
jgi:hypothetical protein